MVETAAGLLPKDLNNEAIQVAGDIQTEDDTGTPLVSPIPITVAITEINIPLNAAVLHMNAITDVVRYGENNTLSGSGTGNGYDIALVGVPVVIPCMNRNSIFVTRNSGDCTLNFHFEMIE